MKGKEPKGRLGVLEEKLTTTESSLNSNKTAEHLHDDDTNICERFSYCKVEEIYRLSFAVF